MLLQNLKRIFSKFFLLFVNGRHQTSLILPQNTQKHSNCVVDCIERNTFSRLQNMFKVISFSNCISKRIYYKEEIIAGGRSGKLFGHGF